MTFSTPSRPGTPGGTQEQHRARGPVVIDVDEQSFQTEVVERSQHTPVVIDFWAPWCGPCRTLGPTLEKLANEARGAWVLAKVNVDNNPRLAQAFGVQGIPAVKGVNKGRLVAEFTGAQPESQVRAWLKGFVPEKAEETPAEDLAALVTRDPVAAEALARQILESEPANDEARVALGRLLVTARDPEGAELLRAVQPGSAEYTQAQAWLTLNELLAEVDPAAAFELLSRVDGNPGDLEARYQLAAHQIAGSRYQDAVEQLLAIVGRDRQFRSDGARKALVALFTALGDQHPVVGPARRQLANLLF